MKLIQASFNILKTVIINYIKRMMIKIPPSRMNESPAYMDLDL